MKLPYDVSTAAGQKRLMDESAGREHIPSRAVVATTGDYGSDPIGNGMFRMAPSGDIVDYAERNRRRGVSF